LHWEKDAPSSSLAELNTLDPEEVGFAVLLACTQSAKSRIIEVQMRPVGRITRTFPASDFA
jgi:hypothetical protein